MDFYTVEEETSETLRDTDKIVQGLRRAKSSAGPLTYQGIRLLRAGQCEDARLVLSAALADNRADVLAWLWHAAAAPTLSEKRTSLVRALRIDPSNPAAWYGLAYLDKNHPTARPAAPIIRDDRPVMIYGGFPLTQPMHARPPVLNEKLPPGSWPGRSEVLLRAGPSLLPSTAASSVFALLLGAITGLVSLSGPLTEVWPVLLILLLIGLATVLLQFAWRMSMECTLTNRWLVIESGVVRRRSVRIPLTALKDVECRSWWWMKRFTGAGDLVLHFRDSEDDLRIRNVAGCKLVAEQMRTALQQLNLQRRS